MTDDEFRAWRDHVAFMSGKALPERFESLTEKGANCWIWRGSRRMLPFDYGRIGHGSRRNGTHIVVGAHRVAWMLHHDRAVPPGLSVLHSCDNPPCVNPSHLRVGTQADNLRDRTMRQRASALSHDDVRAIRHRWARGERNADIAADYGIARRTASSIGSRSRQGAVTDDEPVNT